jgi:two-component system, NarL family, invasion response regulator UvrY
MVQQNIRILIADDHVVVREGLKQFLSETPGLEIAGEAGSGREALAKIRKEQWDLVLLDISMPDQSGIEVLKEIKRESPNLPVLIFSMFSEDEYALSTLQSGASGFVTKESAPEQLIEAIRRVAQGGKYVSSSLAEKLLSQTLPQRKPLAHELLSKREFEILLCISRGQSLTSIGERLHLSVKTVSTYRTRILEKLGLSTNAELTRYVVKHRLDQ